MTPPTVFHDETKSVSLMRDRMFVKQPKKFNMLVEVEKLHQGRVVVCRRWKVIGAVSLCATRPIDRVAPLQCDTHLLERLGLSHLGDIKNRSLAQQLREMK